MDGIGWVWIFLGEVKYRAAYDAQHLLNRTTSPFNSDSDISHFRTSYSLHVWIKNIHSTTTSTTTVSQQTVRFCCNQKSSKLFVATKKVLEKNWFWNPQLDFPAVTVCNQNRVHCANLRKLHGMVDSTIKNEITALYKVTGCDSDNSNFTQAITGSYLRGGRGWIRELQTRKMNL